MTANRTIGVHFREGLEQSRRTLDGVLKYLESQPQLRIRDFMNDDLLTSGVPPWAGRVDGMVVGVGRSKGIAQWLLRGRAPVVKTSRDLRSEPKIVSVFTDSRSIAKLAVEHFLQIGKKNIAFIGHRHTDVSRERIEALSQELAAHHLRLRAFETEAALTGTFQDFASLDQAEPKFVRFLQRAKKPLAVLCLNDRFAVAVCRIVHELGFSIPEDAAVLGMGDFELSRIAPIPISSMRTNNEQVGFESTRSLHRLMEGHRLAKRDCRSRSSILWCGNRPSASAAQRVPTWIARSNTTVSAPGTTTMGLALALNGEIGNDTISVESAPAGSTLALQGGVGNDAYQLGGAANLVDNILIPITIADTSGVDSLTLNDSADLSGDTVTITDSTIDGVNEAPSPNVSFSAIEALDVTTSGGADTITTTLNATNGLVTVNVRGAGGDDDFFLNTADGMTTLTTINLVGDAGNDDFGSAMAPIHPLAGTTTNVAVYGDTTAITTNPGGAITDRRRRRRGRSHCRGRRSDCRHPSRRTGNHSRPRRRACRCRRRR